MKNVKIILSGAALFSACSYLPAADSVAPWREDFNQTEKKENVDAPVNWKVDATIAGVSQTSFYVVEDKDVKSKKLVIDANKATGGLVCNPSKQVDLTKTPILRWKWRVKNLPPGGDGRVLAKDDQALAIYIGFRDWFRKKTVSYRYESETPAGDTGQINYGLVKVKWYCLRNKNDATDRWYTEERNVAEDLKKAYGFVPKDFALSVCANSQYTSSHTIAEVDYLEFVPEKKK